MASQVGVSGISIGALAERTGMSKSGLFAHFGSKEDMQLAVVETSVERFAETVVAPALREKRGLPRLRAMLRNWLAWYQVVNLPGGCPIQSAAIEFDDQPGPIHDAVRLALSRWRETLARAVRISIEEGHLRPDTDVEQFVFEAKGIVMSYHQSSRLHKEQKAAERAMLAFDRLVRDYAPSSGAGTEE